VSIGVETEQERSAAKRNVRLLAIYLAVSMILAWVIFFVINPLSSASTGLGVPSGPVRYLWAVLLGILYDGPQVIFFSYYYIHQQRWLAQDIGVPYEEGKKYPWMTPKRLVGMAMGIAFFGISGIVPAGTFDFAQFAAVFLTIVYGPLEGGTGVALGWLIRGPVFTGVLSPVVLLNDFIWDGSTYFTMGVVYRKFILPQGANWRSTAGLATYAATQMPLHITVGWFIPSNPYIMTTTGPAFAATWTTINFYYKPFAYFPNLIIAYLVADRLQKYIRAPAEAK